MRNPDNFEELESIKVPILDVVGEFDDVAIRTLAEDQELIRQKASNCPNFTKIMVPGANHSYDRREKEFAETVLEWVKSLTI
jgi:pimeloyl-ACP methyl ester carboxylesterase